MYAKLAIKAVESTPLREQLPAFNSKSDCLYVSTA